MRIVLRVLLILVILVAIGYGVMRYISGGTSSLIPSRDDLASKGYSAVFLTNDQVYFGKASVSGGQVVLKDVYYIRLNQTDEQTSENSTEQPQLSLVKLGDQIHGPSDEMRINRDHVLFIERIKDDSTVVKGIISEKEKKAAQDS